jgi:rod shape-determining protein MreD
LSRDRGIVKSFLWVKLDTIARQITPFGLTMTLTLLTVLPLQVPYLGVAGPVWAMMSVYYWALYRPDLMPALAVFLVGLMLDALSGTPLGVNALVLLIVHRLVVTQRRFFYDKPFVIVWFGFGLVTAGAFAAAWLLTSLWHATILDSSTLILRSMLTLALFPLVFRALFEWQRLFLKQV